MSTSVDTVLGWPLWWREYALYLGITPIVMGLFVAYIGWTIRNRLFLVIAFSTIYGCIWAVGYESVVSIV